MGGQRIGKPPPVDGRGLEAPCVLFPGKGRCGHSRQYGAYHLEGRQTTAHRAAFVAAYGPVPDDHQVDHRCSVHLCWLPDHLEAVTSVENRRRAGQVVLTLDIAQDCRRRHAVGAATCRELADQYGLTYQGMWRILKGLVWRVAQ